MAKRVYGIDLGTTYSCISYVDEHGKPVVLANAEGQLTTPSVVHFESADSIVAGQSAKAAAMIYPERVISTIKRSMGDPTWEREFDGKVYRPQDISAKILLKLVKDAESIIGAKIEDVVITCPAYFGIPQKEKTKQAGQLAGLNVLYVIPEPTAAAIAYGIEQTDTQNILVYDLGGGTFDVTLLRVSPSEITVVSTGGDDKLGGKDWDDAIVTYLMRAFETKTGTPVDEDMEAYHDLLKGAEEIKVTLSTRKSSQYLVRSGTSRAVIDVTREKFDELTQGLLERTVSMTDEMLERAKSHGIAKIDKLLLVGGSTYMPQVIERMSRFPFETKQFDPNQAVAKGAALYGYQAALERAVKIQISEKTGQTVDSIDLQHVPAAIKETAERDVALSEGLALAGLKKLANKRIVNVTSKSYGIVLVQEKQNRREIVMNFIVVDDRVPREISREVATLDDGQTEVELRIMQNQQRTGPNDIVELSECDPSDPIGTAVVSFARPLPKGSPVNVTICLGPDGCVSLRGRDLTTGGEVEATFELEGLYSKEEVIEARSRALAITDS